MILKSSKKKAFILPHADDKTEQWIKTANTNSLFLQLKTNPAFHAAKILHFSISTNTRPIYFFRYLNDYPSLTITTIRTILDLLTIITCLTLNGKVRWIAHNIDRETETYHPKLSFIRRRLIIRYSERIYFTDPQLIQSGCKHLQIPTEKASWTCFGPPELRRGDNRNTDIINSILTKKNEGSDLLVGLCATALKNKCQHLHDIEKILDQANCGGRLELILVVVCNISDTRSDGEMIALVERLRRRIDIILFTDGIKVDEKKLNTYVDFIYRSLNDLSVPATIFHSAHAKLPIVTHPVGHCGSMVLHYNLGFIIDDSHEFSIGELRSFLSTWDKANCDRFLERFNWGEGSNQLFQ